MYHCDIQTFEYFLLKFTNWLNIERKLIFKLRQTNFRNEKKYIIKHNKLGK